MYWEFLDFFLRFIELFNGMFKSRYAPLVCDWDAEDHKVGVNNHANLDGALIVTMKAPCEFAW